MKIGETVRNNLGPIGGIVTGLAIAGYSLVKAVTKKKDEDYDDSEEELVELEETIDEETPENEDESE